MARLSNLLRLRDGLALSSLTGRRPPREVTYRPAQRTEIDAAVRLILGGTRGRADDETVLHFLNTAVQRKIDFRHLWVADAGGTIDWALLAIPSPGRTVLLLSPICRVRSGQTEVPNELLRRVADHWRLQGFHVAQVLLEPEAHLVAHGYTQAGFDRIADLIYLTRPLRGIRPAPPPPTGVGLHYYSRETHSRFARMIQASYQDSLDCPALNGVRDMDDVIEGHKACGEFEPTHWALVSHNAEDVGVLLLSRTPVTDAMELVYVGLARHARGRGIAPWLLRYAFQTAAEAGCEHLNLAVDSQNKPALRLYQSQGMRKMYERIALLRDLRKQVATDGVEEHKEAQEKPA
jgi:ribosomal protein S18 acetylase RimI-like enzyme